MLKNTKENNIQSTKLQFLEFLKSFNDGLTKPENLKAFMEGTIKSLDLIRDSTVKNKAAMLFNASFPLLLLPPVGLDTVNPNRFDHKDFNYEKAGIHMIEGIMNALSPNSKENNIQSTKLQFLEFLKSFNDGLTKPENLKAFMEGTIKSLDLIRDSTVKNKAAMLFNASFPLLLLPPVGLDTVNPNRFDHKDFNYEKAGIHMIEGIVNAISPNSKVKHSSLENMNQGKTL